MLKLENGNIKMEAVETIEKINERYPILVREMTILLSRMEQTLRQNNLTEYNKIKKKISDVIVFMKDIENFIKGI